MESYLAGALPPQPDQVANVDLWLEQQIWGHRLYIDQTPWLVLLEALGIMAFRHADKNIDRIFPGMEAGKHEQFRYSMAPRQELRTILFKNHHIDDIASSDVFDDGLRWSQWFGKIASDGRGEKQFGYLRDRFKDFSSFRNAIALLRSSRIESERKRRVTSWHLAPRGPDMLAADYGERKKGGVNKDRRFFSRGGELLYLMLNRSSKQEELEELVARRLLTKDSRWNALARVLQPDDLAPPLDFDVGYLPMPSHPAYDLIAEDWVSVLSLEALIDDHVPEPLMRLTGLGIIRYMVERAAEVLDISPPPIPIDMVAASTVGVKRISQDYFRRHRDMTRDAIKRLTEEFAASDEWRAALAQPNKAGAAKDLVRRRFGFEWPERAADIRPEDYPAFIAKEAMEDHEQHLGRVIGFYAEQIGIAVAGRGSGRWYAASDGLLEALVLANVREPMEVEAFLTTLWKRYGIVVGSEVSRDAFEVANYGHFKANQRLLEDRLRVLGLVHRLSDDCAFVHNPFFEVAR